MDFSNWKKPEPKEIKVPKAREFDPKKGRVLVKLLSNFSCPECHVSGLAGANVVVPYEKAQEICEAGFAVPIKGVEDGEEVEANVQLGFDNEAGNEDGEDFQDPSPASEEGEEADEKPAASTAPDPIEILKKQAEEENAPYKEAQKATGGRRQQKLNQKTLEADSK